MRASVLGSLVSLAIVSTLLFGCEKDVVSKSSVFTLEDDIENGEFVHGIVIELDGVGYYLDGPEDGPNGEKDMPGYFWKQVSSSRIIGESFNTGPFGTMKWWSSHMENGEHMYSILGVIDIWTLDLAEEYAKKGFVHYHELVSVDGGSYHPSKVLWLKHIAQKSIVFNGPNAPNRTFEHEVSPGVDANYPVNYMKAYPAE